MVEIKRHNLIAEINRLFDVFCTSNHETCKNKTCKFLHLCYKEDFNSNPPRKNIRLKSVKKNVSQHITKTKGRNNPNNEGQTFRDRIKFILGCDILEHELIKGHMPSIISVQKATTILQIVNILEKRNIAVNSKSKLWHYDPKHYRKKGMARKNILK